MTEKIVGLFGNRPSQLGEPRAELIKCLESLLERARTGHLQSFIGTGFVSDGARLSVFVDLHENVYEMLGALAWLGHEYADRVTRREPSSK